MQVDKVVLYINGNYAADIPAVPELSPDQRRYIERMDRDMRVNGVRFGPEHIEHPDDMQRAQNVVSHLVQAVHDNNAAAATAMFAYLVTRQPDLESIRVQTNGQVLSTDFHYRS